MSGGAFDYFYYQLEEHVGDFGDVELDDLMSDLAKLHHDREWYKSGDTSEGSWNEARDEFKARWFTSDGRAERTSKYIDDAINKLRIDLGMKKEYCGDCSHWTSQDKINAYGECEYAYGYLNHRSESACERFEERS